METGSASGSVYYNTVFAPQVVFFNMPLTYYLCWSLHHRCRGTSFRSHFCRPGCRWWTLAVHLGMLVLLIWQAYSCFFLLETYGPLAFFLSPVRTWALLMALVLVYRVWWGPQPHFSDRPLWQWCSHLSFSVCIFLLTDFVSCQVLPSSCLFLSVTELPIIPVR